MNLYSNSFTIYTNEDHSEVVVQFSQRAPIISPKDGTVSQEEHLEPLSSIVMNEKTAKTLIEYLNQVLSKKPGEAQPASQP